MLHVYILFITPPQTVEELNVLNDMLLAQNQITDNDGNTFIDTMQSLKDAEEQAKDDELDNEIDIIDPILKHIESGSEGIEEHAQLYS